jgi:hypothetical protein
MEYKVFEDLRASYIDRQVIKVIQSSQNKSRHPNLFKDQDYYEALRQKYYIESVKQSFPKYYSTTNQ